MKGFFNRIFKLLNFSGRDWIVFLLALLLAFSTWIIHRLSLNYSVYLKVDVVAESNLEGRAAQSVSGTEVMARCRTTGWRILYSRLIREPEVTVTFPASVFHHEEQERYYVTSEKLHEYVDEIFGQKVSVEYFVTDKVYFKFQEEVFKKVPVKAISSLSFDDQYVANGPMILVPDSVTVYGDHLHLEALEYVTTATIQHSTIHEDFSGMIPLTPINGMRFSVDEVHYKMDVTRYLEVVRKTVPVKVKGAPAGKTVTTDPSTVDVLLKVVFPLKADPKKDLTLTVDYKDVETSITGQVKIKPSSLPAGVISYDITPVAVKIVEGE